MRNLLIAIILLSLFTGTPVVAGNAVVTNGIVASENILDKLIALVKEYTGRVEAATSMEELDTAYRTFKQEMAEFTEKHADEIAAFDKNLSTEQIETYKVAFETAIKHFEKSLEKKAMLFME